MQLAWQLTLKIQLAGGSATTCLCSLRQLRWRYQGQQEALRERKPAPHLVWDRLANQSRQSFLYSYSKYPSSRYSLMLKKKTDLCSQFFIDGYSHGLIYITRADSRLVPSPWETLLQSNAFSHWLGANLDSALLYSLTVLFILRKWNLMFPFIAI